MGDSSNSPKQDVPPPPPVIWLRIWPDGMQSFAPNLNTCTQEISEVIKSMYDHPWPTCTQIPTDVRERWFQKKIYDHRVAKRLQQMISDVRQGKDHLILWIHPNIKCELEAYFRENDGFKRRRLTNIANRASPRLSRYTGGSMNFIKTKTKLSKSLDRDAILAETFKYTHTLKANRERFADKWRSTCRSWRPRRSNLSRLMGPTKPATRHQWWIPIGFDARPPLNSTRINASASRCALEVAALLVQAAMLLAGHRQQQLLRPLSRGTTTLPPSRTTKITEIFGI
ncbi:uncharacterized protein DS421_15g491470 [Arachis hypogaea]|nr:uncharacterized protein DS421_15g491470 [Arachis hypogaea]